MHSDFWQKVLWIALPICVGTGVTLIPGPAEEIRIIAYSVLALVAAFGVWATNARKRRFDAEKRDQERWDALNARLDLGDKADRAMLRNELVRMHREWVEEKGYIILEALEYVTNTYEIYHDLGGNGSGTKLYEDLKATPVREKR